MADFPEMNLTSQTQAAAYATTDEKAMKARQDLCDKHSNFKIQDISKDQVKDLADLIYYMVAEERTTVHIVSGNTQCESHRRRSSEDVYMCAKYYLKGIDYTTVLKALMACTGADDKLLTYNFCSVVVLRVFFNRYSKATLEGIRKVLEAVGLNYKAPAVVKKKAVIPAKNVVKKPVKRKV